MKIIGFREFPFSRVISASLLAIAAISPAVAEDFTFADQRIEAVVPGSEGGSGDTYMRFVAPKLKAKLAGDPVVVVRNMPGGGSILAANWFDAQAPKDGTAFMVLGTTTTLTYALRPDDPEVQYNPEKWKAFMASPMGRVIYVHADTGIKGLEDLKTFDGELLMGLQNPTGSDMPSLLALELLGVEVKSVAGTDGGDQNLAFMRGEFTANADTTSAYKQMGAQLEKDGTAVPLFSFGFENAQGEIVRDPNFPDLPSWVEAYEIVHGKAPSGPEFETWKSLFQMAVMGSKPLVLPADTPDDVVAAYVAAAEALVADPEFQAEAGQYIGDYPQLTGEAAQRNLQSSVVLSPAAREWLTVWVKERFGIDL